jgi:hypothetical protein
MGVLSSELRSVLERAIVAARDVAEEASRQALEALGVGVDRTVGHLGDEERRLRVALRAEARQLGGFDRLAEEAGYEQWHCMLFARFLAENGLLMHPEHGVSVSLADCEEIAHGRGEADPWVVASEFASVMLPGIFRQEDPVLQLQLTPEGQRTLEAILADLPAEVFTSDDGLGWVYQYWQAKKKKEVNASERKIGGADIAPVTQLFTEHYMVAFLLENTLGAWWAARRPESPLLKEWEYLRFDEEGKPAAGSFSGWPESVAEVTVMDPCCGSGHFLVTAFEMLRMMRMEADGLTAAQAGDAVLRENLFGLELDARCTQIAAFALALQAWRSGGYRELPIPNVACSGISAKGRLEDWTKLAAGDERLERSMERLHALFVDAADLGSLIDPLRQSGGDLLAAQFEDIAPLLQSALDVEQLGDPSSAAFGNAVAGAARATSLLARQYTLVTTNPPFLGRGRQDDRLKSYCARNYPTSKAELAICFFHRARSLVSQSGTIAMVTPQHWLFLGTYRSFRKAELEDLSFSFVVGLGSRAFTAISGEVVRAALVCVVNASPEPDNKVLSFDLGRSRTPTEKAVRIRVERLIRTAQLSWQHDPDHTITVTGAVHGERLASRANCNQGIGTADANRFIVRFWEVPLVDSTWEPYQMAPNGSGVASGCHSLLRWEQGNGVLAKSPQARICGQPAWGRRGVAAAVTSEVHRSVYLGTKYDCTLAAITAKEDAYLPAISTFVLDSHFPERVRAVDQAMSVTESSFLKVPFDDVEWTKQASDRFPDGLPHPNTDEPTQWLFDGQPRDSAEPLQVAFARLAGYRWPRQTGSEFMGCPALDPDGLEPSADEDGVMCIPSVRGERPAATRLRALLRVGFEDEWSPAKEADLLAETGYSGKSLEQWLRDGFFEQHCQLFHQRPFVWQIWDGRKDGFSALVNYHRLDRAMLERLIYTYLGDWIGQQRAGVEAGTAGSEARLAAAQELQRKLELILEGEQPYDTFVRWKPLEGQPIGWAPDLNDGVRLNIRPFVTAGVLRKNPKISWNKDRGKDLESAPWYPVFQGDRINDHHLTLAEKRAAREAAARRESA